MAKSLRAKTKVRARGVRRKTIYAPVELARTTRLSQKLSETVNGSGDSATEAGLNTTEGVVASTAAVAEPEIAMEVDSAPAEQDKSAKISTSGWKGSRNEQWKQKKASKIAGKRRQGSRTLTFGSRTKKGKKV
ncbi:hypothetical protein V1514DRAFT_338591 [Lipomyces japonicus]|uniref:uncharacterized protein n=1 Tax=Lipomyces japonicus TaxID=56871 RepID=UPI0034CE7F67